MKTQILSAMLLTALMLVTVGAMGISSPYWTPDAPLRLAQGETKIVNLNLQNLQGDGNAVTVSAEIKEGGDFVFLKKETYTARFGTSDTMIPLTVKMPSEAVVGSARPIQIEFKTITSGEGGMVKMGTGYTVEFNLITTAKQVQLAPANNNWIWFAVLGVIVILVVVWYFARQRKSSK